MKYECIFAEDKNIGMVLLPTVPLIEIDHEKKSEIFLCMQLVYV